LPNTWAHKTQEVSKRGIPDILACMCGVFVALELKDENAKPQTHEALQDHILKEIAQCGGVSAKVTQKTWPPTFKFLSTIAHQQAVHDAVDKAHDDGRH
jgi:Holliday junction resolvase